MDLVLIQLAKGTFLCLNYCGGNMEQTLQWRRQTMLPAWLWDSLPRMVGTLGMEKSRRMNTYMIVNRKNSDKFPCASRGPCSTWKFNSSRFFHSHGSTISVPISEVRIKLGLRAVYFERGFLEAERFVPVRGHRTCGEVTLRCSQNFSIADSFWSFQK